MKFPERRSGVIFWSVVLMLSAALYIGAYAATVKRFVARHFNGADPSATRPTVTVYYVNQNYRMNLILTKAFFPVHCIDRRLRHDYWTGG